MPPATLTGTAASNWGDLSSGSETTATLTWNAADVVLVVGYTEDASFTLGTPTATGLSFSALGSAQATANSCWVHAWTATAASGGSTTVTSAPSPATTQDRGIQAYAFGNCTGILRTSAATLNATQTVSVTRTQANSLIVCILADWSASGTAGLAWTPAGQTQRQAAVTTNATKFLADWPDQGSAGTTSYGTTGLSGTKFTIAAFEILGTVGAPAFVAAPPVSVLQAVNRSYTY